MTPSLSDIIDGLTEAQKRRLIEQDEKRFSRKDWLTFEGLERTPLMKKCGWISEWGGHNLYRFTPLGSKCRAALQASSKASDGEVGHG